MMMMMMMMMMMLVSDTRPRPGQNLPDSSSASGVVPEFVRVMSRLRRVGVPQEPSTPKASADGGSEIETAAASDEVVSPYPHQRQLKHVVVTRRSDTGLLGERPNETSNTPSSLYSIPLRHVQPREPASPRVRLSSHSVWLPHCGA